MYVCGVISWLALANLLHTIHSFLACVNIFFKKYKKRMSEVTVGGLLSRETFPQGDAVNSNCQKNL